MNVPIISATGFERDIGDINLFMRYGCKVAITGEILCIGCVRFSYREYHFTLESGLCIYPGCIFCPYLLGKPKSGPCFRPSCIKTYMCDDFGYLRATDTVILGRLEMERQWVIRYTLANEWSDRNQTTVTQTEFVSAAPDFAEKDIVVEFRKFRGKITKLIAPGCLFDFFLCHTCYC